VVVLGHPLVRRPSWWRRFPSSVGVPGVVAVVATAIYGPVELKGALGMPMGNPAGGLIVCHSILGAPTNGRAADHRVEMVFGPQIS